LILLRRSLTALICLLPVSAVKPWLLRCLGHHVSTSVRIAPSVILVDRLHLGDGVKIGFLNFIRINRLLMKPRSYIGLLNFIHGDFNVGLAEEAAIGNRNLINRGLYLGPRTPSLLSLGQLSKITASHYVNLIAPVSFGAFSVLGGSGSQIWTHGYVHHATGPGRDEVKRPVKIGSNVYIGSMCCISPGVRIGDGVAVGSHSSVAKDLEGPGLYVSAPLRRIEPRE
jgi:acetyltransferase-like isoleucine patch superfamily enzyme